MIVTPDKTEDHSKTEPWYLKTWFLVLLLVASIFTAGLTGVAGIVLLLIKNSKANKKNSELLIQYSQLKLHCSELEKINFTKEELEKLDLEQEKENLKYEIDSLRSDADLIKEKFRNEIEIEKRDLVLEIRNLTLHRDDERRKLLIEIEETESLLKKSVSELSIRKNLLFEEVSKAESHLEKIEKNIVTEKNRLNRTKPLYQSMLYTLDTYIDKYLVGDYNRDISLRLSDSDTILLDDLSPTVTLHLHSMDVKDLRNAYRENEKLIKNTLEKYQHRYTTKANLTIYALMVLALQAETQNILYNLKFGRLSDSIENVKSMTQKYIKIASDGNQNISATMIKFIGEIEFLFIRAIEIEFEYLIRKEQTKQEQAALREQMRQEAEEKKELERQRKHVEMEEQKYKNELQSLEEQKTICQDDEKIKQLEERIQKLSQQLSEVEKVKEDIINLQNGKAGNVYIISNIGSFGENVFKIGMTRRLDPQDRVNELGSASVPFKFDVHSFIFSEDAVALEQKLHSSLSSERINKVNLRKEFFRASLDKLEEIVTNIDPTAEFNRTILAEEFKQSLSLMEELPENINQDLLH